MRRVIFGLGAFLLLVSCQSAPSAVSTRAAAKPQNIVLILTDDQRYDSLQYMPNVESLLVQHGVTYTNAVDSDSLCCPTRTSIMTGLTSGHSGVWTNLGFPEFTENGDQNRQVFQWLHDDGYQTALIGKFLQSYPDASWVLPGVDDWQAAITVACGGVYWGACYSDNRTVVQDPPTAYSTTTFGDKAVQFIDQAKRNRPLFLYFAPRAPHLPTEPEPKYASACANVPSIRGPSYNRAIVDGPKYMTSLPRWTAAERQQEDALWRADCQTLLSVDDQVGRIVDALQRTHRLSNTLIVYASDNGVAFGENRWFEKLVPYEASIRVPLVIRDDALLGDAPRTQANLVSSLDYTPTFLQVAGLSRPGLDGKSFLAPGGDRAVLLEGAKGPVLYWAGKDGYVMPAFCGVRTARFMFAHYSTGEEELYDLKADPSELRNIASERPRPTNRLRALTRKMCDPPAPGVTWP